MFVLHPSSRCDVCLEGFSWEVEMAPYAIPCGHVFCKRCLESVVPPKCPMCRKNFDPSRLKKLHVDRPEGEEDPREGDLLQRVAMSFEAPEEHRRDLLDEIDKWLEEKHADAAQPLRKARTAIEKYQELRETGIEDKRKITDLEQEKKDTAAAAEIEKERTTAIEKNLLDLNKELQAQLAAAHSEKAHLHAEMQRRSQMKNPLPPPPQPTTLNVYGNFDSTVGPNAWYNDDGRSMFLPSRASVSIPNGVSYVHPRNLYPEDDRENRTQILHESNGVKRDRKGKSRDIPDPAYDMFRSGYGPPPTYHPALEVPKPKPGIIPGASPKSKFMPPDPETEVRERGFNAFKPPDPVPPTINGRVELPHKGFDPARDAVDTYSLTASMLAELQNGLNEGFNRGFQAIQRAIPPGMPSGNRTKDSDPEAGGYASDIERQERRRRRREREREKEKQRERDRDRDRDRDQDRPRREHRSRREREREEPHASSSRRSDPPVSPDEAASLASAVKGSSRGEESQEHRARYRQRASGDVDHTHEPNVPMPDNSTRQRAFSESRPRTGGPIPPHPVIPTPVAPIPPPSQPIVQQQQNLGIQPLAQPTPRVPLQPHLEELDHSAEVMQTPGSRHSTSTTDSWGTVASLSQASENSFNSLNLRTLPRQPTIPLNAQPYRSPSRPTPLQDLPQPERVESTDEETETEHVIAPVRNPEMDDSGRGNRTSRTRRRNHERNHTAGGSSGDQHWPSHPLSAPPTALGPGTRHTQALVTPHYQNPTLSYQLRPPSMRSASTAATVTPEAVARSSRNGRPRRDSQHRSRHSSSQVPTSAVIPGTHYSSSSSSNPTNVRTRRVSFNAVSNVNGASTAPFSLENATSAMVPHSANDIYENDLGYHTDMPFSGNALGLAGLAEPPADGDHSGAQRGSAGLPISAPRPVTPNTSFLRSFSHDNYS